MEDIIIALGRQPRQRTTLYGEVSPERIAASFGASPLLPMTASPVTATPMLDLTDSS